MSEGIDAIERLSEAYAKAHQLGDGAALAQMFWDDAVIIPPAKKAVVGRRAIDSFFSGVLGGSSLTNEESHIVADGNIGYDYGTASWMEESPWAASAPSARPLAAAWTSGSRAWSWSPFPRATTNRKKRFLHFVDVYQRKDGAWRIQLSTWNSSEGIAE